MTAPDSAQLPSLAGAAVDRAAAERTTADLLETTRADAATRVLVVAGDAAPLAAPDALQWSAAAAVPDGGAWAFLGRDADGAALLTAVFAASDDQLFAAPAGWAGLRAVGGALSAHDAEPSSRR